MTSATSRIFGVRPKPNHSTTSGAIATSGRVWLMTKTGNRARLRRGMKSIRTDSANATLSEKAKPVSVACSVGSVLAHNSSRLATTWPITRDGAGRTNGEMPDPRT